MFMTTARVGQMRRLSPFCRRLTKRGASGTGGERGIRGRGHTIPIPPFATRFPRFGRGEQPRKAEGGSCEKKRINRVSIKIGAPNVVDQHAAQALENIGRRQRAQQMGCSQPGRTATE